jgi:hypothetical protein
MADNSSELPAPELPISNRYKPRIEYAVDQAGILLAKGDICMRKPLMARSPDPSTNKSVLMSCYILQIDVV